MKESKTLSSFLEELRQQAINFQLDEEKFWNMTIGEVNRYLQGCLFREERQTKTRASMDYKLAISLVSVLGASMSSKPIPPIHELYPDLFEEDKTAKSVANFMAFANSHNRKFKNKE